MSRTPLRARKAAPLAQPNEAAGSAADLTTREAAQYIAEFAGELSFLARRSRLDLLAYLLDMARLEATRAVRTEAGRSSRA